MTIERVFLTHTDTFNQVITIYEKAFPKNEQQTIATLKSRIAANKEHLYVGKFNEEVIAIGFLYDLPKTEFLVLDYLAIAAKHQHKGVGSIFLKKIIDIVHQNKKHLILEVDNPNYEPDKEIKNKRVAFYKKNGAQIIEGLRYILPSLNNTLPTEQILMIVPFTNFSILSKQVLINLVNALYKELYSLSSNHKYLETIRFSINNHSTN